MIRRRVESDTTPPSRKARDTVIVETPARSATSAMVGTGRAGGTAAPIRETLTLTTRDANLFVKVVDTQ